ncbi:MAG: hypothetical protein JWN43_3081 [Gammaproteobacteria bacterium]|nr:hypothetical protein [Gammaproteobacteria bacterium]
MKALGWLWFVIVQLIELVALILGLIVLLVLAATKCWYIRESRYFPGRQITVWRGGYLSWPWGNEEDGVTGEASTQRAATYAARYPNIRIRAFMWSALRNPANNLRFVFRWRGGPFYRWENASHTFYFQAGWYANGYPVLSAGGM